MTNRTQTQDKWFTEWRDEAFPPAPRLPRSREVAMDWLWLLSILASAALIVRGAVAVVGDALWLLRAGG